MTSIPATLAPCADCETGPAGEAGHASLALYVGGPYPGHHIFRCNACGSRWIRHYGSPEQRFAWTAHAAVLPPKRRPSLVPKGIPS